MRGHLVDDDGAERELPAATIVPVEGERVSAVVVGGPPEELPGPDVDLAAIAGVVTDRELVHLEVRLAHRERVKELQALRGVQIAVGTGAAVTEVLDRTAGALADGLQYPEDTRVEIELDGRHVVAGADGELAVSLDHALVVDGVPRGRLRVGYVRDHPFLDHPFLDHEEPELVEAAGETLEAHLARLASREQATASAERLQQVMVHLPAAVWLTDRDLTANVLAVGAAAPLGPAGVSVQLEHWDEPVGPEIVALHHRALGGERVHDELWWRDRWWQVRLEPLADADGTVSEVLGLAVDVSEQRRARDLEAELAAIVEGAALAIVGVDLEDRITSWNRGAVELFGWRPEEVVGRHVDVLAPTDLDVVGILPFRDDLPPGEVYAPYTETKRRHRDGHDVEVGMWLSPITAREGTPLGASCIYQDLAERNRARRALEESEAHFRLLADTAQDVVYRVRFAPEPAVAYINPICEQVLGMRQESFDQPLDLLEEHVHPGDRDVVFRRDRDPGEPTAVRFRWRHGDGHWIWLEDRRTPIIEDGRVVGVVGIARDVTIQVRSEEALRTALERERRATEELRRVDELRTSFLRAVSHELRTPLTSILGFAETAERLSGDAEAQRGYLHRVVANARRLETLVNDLLDVERLAHDHDEARMVPIDLDELVRRVLRRTEAGDHRLELDVAPTRVVGDATTLERAVDNLVRNAVRHTPPGTTIVARVRATDDGAEVVVEDDGPGVPAELRQRIFEPFEQGAEASGSASPGTGIGLSLVRRFVELHAGTVTLGDRPGGGARFTIRLPGGATGDAGSSS